MMKKFLSLLALVLVASCSTLKSSEPQATIYSLRPLPPAQTEGLNVLGIARVVEIMKPTMPPGFERDRIALYLNNGSKLDYFAAARWSSTLDEVIQNFTRRTATNQLPNVVAVISEQAVDAQFRLQTKVNEFQPVYEGDAKSNPRLITNIEFTLISLPDEKILSSFTMGREGRATSNRLDVITAGLEKMLQDIEKDAFIRLEPWLKNPTL